MDYSSKVHLHLAVSVIQMLLNQYILLEEGLPR